MTNEQDFISGTYTVEWLLNILARRKILNAETRRDVEIKLPQQRARVARQHVSDYGGSSAAAMHYRASPAELIASFELKMPNAILLDEEQLAQVIAQETQHNYYKIDPLELDMGIIARTLSRPFALRHVVLPLTISSDEIIVATDNPFNIEVVESLRRLGKKKISRVIASKQAIIKAITEIYGFRKSVESAARESRTEHVTDFEQLVRLRTVGEIEGTDQHIVNAVDFLLRYAFDQRASDIHIEPRRGDSQVRLRIDGVLHDTHAIPRPVHKAVVSRLKTLSRMDIAEKRRPQDGRIKTVMNEREVELRVSSLPVAFGEKMVIRIFDPQVLLQELPDLGFDANELMLYQKWIARPHGMLLITGPTGSGKTTTLYTTLKTVADTSVNVTSVEDPIEMITERFNQTAVQPKIGLTFASTMRSILRQDPDIVMIGEIRDHDTAQMAVQAALTGHLVLSTLHTNDSVGAVTRLVDLGIPSFLVASTLVGVMAQRLVRKVCTDCREVRSISADQLLALDLSEDDFPRFQNCAYGLGCTNCRGTGYFGRLGVFEMLDVDATVRNEISLTADEAKLRRVSVCQGLRSLKECAFERLAQGLTTPEEVIRITGL